MIYVLKIPQFKMPRLESNALKYGYSNARAKAMKGLLLKGGTLDEMIRVGTVEAMIELLHRTSYKNDLAAVPQTYSGSAMVESAASLNFARTIRKLIKITPKSDRSALQALLVRWDLMNLKTIMHAKKLKQSYESIQPHLLDVGGMDEEDFKRIMGADDTSLLREVRRTRLGEMMLATGTSQSQSKRQMRDKFVRALRSLDAFMQMESIVDGYIYLFIDDALSSCEGNEGTQIRKMLNLEIDAKNILIIERLKKHNASKDKVMSSLIKGGTMGELLLKKLIETKDLPGTYAIIKTKFPKLKLKDESKKMSLSELEIALEKSVAAQKTLAFHRAIMSIGVVMGFAFLKEEEISNLRKIAKGKEFNIPENEVREMLVAV